MKSFSFGHLALFYIVVLLFKIGETAWLTHLESCHSPFAFGSWLGNTAGDSFSYIGAMENYISKGEYFFLNDKGEIIRAGRLPHYAIPYFILRQIFSHSTALDLFVVFQLMVESLAILCLALLAKDLTRRAWPFYLSLLLSVASVYITVWSYNTFTDALSANLILIAAFFYYRYNRVLSKWNFILFSLLLGLITCLRPYMILIYGLVGLVEGIRYKWDFRILFKQALLLTLPLILLLAPWVYRNNQVLGKPIIFQQDMYAGYGFTKADLEIRKVLTLMGEDGGAWWDRKTAASYFSPRAVDNSNFSYPSYIRKDTGMYNILESFRASCLKLDSQIILKGATVLNIYREKYPLRFYAYNRIKLAARFLVNNGSFHLPVDRSSPCYQPWQMGYKFFQSLLYFLCLLPGTLGLLMMARMKKHYLLFLVPSVFLLILFPIYFGLTEWRYFLPFYHFHQLGLVFLLAKNRKIKEG